MGSTVKRELHVLSAGLGRGNVEVRASSGQILALIQVLGPIVTSVFFSVNRRSSYLSYSIFVSR